MINDELGLYWTIAAAILMKMVRKSNDLTLSWRKPLYRNQSIDLLGKSMDWFLYDIGLRHERVNDLLKPDDEATSMNADRKTNFLIIFSSLIM